jgi:thiol:disulfide interchange protein
MFDVIRVDFSRFQSAGAPRAGGLAAALALGAMAALLAGACVAPVVISVLLLSADLYARGHGTGLALPFLLGAGMALPWPLAGAGLSFLPRPGRWMDRVKRAFGVVILLFAAWYGRLGFCLATDRCASSRRLVEQAQDGGASRGGWETSLAAGLARGLEQNRPVLVDIWASWCKNCLKMDSTTFRDPGVTGRLERYVKVKFRAENMGDPGVKAVLDHFEAIGLPTYAVLMPARGGGPAR